MEDITLKTLPEDVLDLRKELDSDLVWVNHVGKKAGKTPSMKHAQEQNARWLRLKLKPYIQRLESFQRGKG